MASKIKRKRIRAAKPKGEFYRILRSRKKRHKVRIVYPERREFIEGLIDWGESSQAASSRDLLPPIPSPV